MSKWAILDGASWSAWTIWATGACSMLYDRLKIQIQCRQRKCEDTRSPKNYWHFWDNSFQNLKIDIFAPIHWFYSCWKTRLRFADKAESFIAQRLVFQYQLAIRISTNIQPTKCMIVISKTSSKISAYCCMQIVFYYIHKAHLRLFKSSELRY